MPIYSSRDRLDAMHNLFTAQGNGRLDAGEVDALAAFHGGLKGDSKAKIHDRMVELYQGSTFSAGQKDRFRGLLQQRGFTVSELEGADPKTAAGFAKLSKGAKFDRITELAADGSDEGTTKVTQLSGLDMMTRGKLQAALTKVEKQIMKEKGPDAIIGDVELRSVFVTGAGGKSERVGFRAEIPIYADDHDVDQAHYFDLKGVHLGSEYVGE